MRQEDVDQAIKGQASYWENLHRDFEYCTKLDTVVTEDVFDLPAYENWTDHYRFKFNAVRSLGNDTYEWMARYWADRHLCLHVGWSWLQEYYAARSSGMTEKEASKKADTFRAGLKKELKEKYP